MKKILIIEDEQVLRDEVAVLLNNSGYEAHCITELHNVAEQMKNSDADLILLDINLPKSTDRRFCRNSAKSATLPLSCSQAVQLRSMKCFQ